jgi:hypothetical protein
MKFLQLTKGLLTAAMMLVTMGCTDAEPAIGLGLTFYNGGPDDLVVERFDPEGIRGPVPGFLGPSRTEGKHMAFMPGDSATRKVPEFIDVQWFINTPEVKAALNRLNEQYPKYSSLWEKGYAEINEMRPPIRQRVDLRPVLTPELLAQVRANRINTQLLLTVVFTGGQVQISAQAEQWRRSGK